MTPEPRSEISAIDDLLAAFDAGPSQEFVGGRLMRATLEARRSRVLRDRFLAEVPDASESLDLGLRHLGEKKGFDVPVLADVLAATQQALVALAQSIKEAPTARGMVPIEIQEAVRLRVAFALPGSLSLHLVPANPDAQQPLFEGATPTLLDHSVEALLSVLEATHDGTSDEALLGHIASAGPRTTTHLETLTTALIDGEATALVRWKSTESTRHVAVHPNEAARLRTVLRDVREEERERILTGRLVGGSLVRQTFELELPDASVLSGRVEEHLLSSLEDLFGRECTATVIVRETSLPSGETREAFVLRALAP